RRATMRRPLRSKRATISPVRTRANASGLTRIRVRDKALGAGLGYRGLLGRAPPAAAGGRLGGRRRLGLAVRAHLPAGIDGPAAIGTRVFELAHAVRTAEEVAVDKGVAVRAELHV